MRSLLRLRRSCDPATNSHSDILELTALSWAFGPAASPHFTVPSDFRVQCPNSAQCAFPLHISDSTPCFSALPARPAKPTSNSPPWLTPADTSPPDPRSFSVVLSATRLPHPASPLLLVSRDAGRAAVAGPSVGPVRSTPERTNRPTDGGPARFNLFPDSVPLPYTHGLIRSEFRFSVPVFDKPGPQRPLGRLGISLSL
jgi:hypothetical protein